MIIGAVVAIAAVCFVFRVGMVVGARRARFSYRWGEQYHRNFGGPKHGWFMSGFSDRDFMDAHGVVGKILHVDGEKIVMQGRDAVERIVLLTPNTSVLQFHGRADSTAIHPDDRIVVIGDPNDAGQIEAKVIRILPSR